MKRLPFLKVLVKVSFQYHLPIKGYGDFNVTDLTSSLLWVEVGSKSGVSPEHPIFNSALLDN